MANNFVTIRTARPADLDKVRFVYASWGYAAPIDATDRILMAECNAELVGLVRLVTESGVKVLRGMEVARAHQGRGIGTALLLRLIDSLKGQACYCLPYAHLQSFYATAGFHEVEASAAPVFLAERLKRYQKIRPDFIMMYRAPRFVDQNPGASN